MAIHDVDIYHCQKCGRVSSCEHEDQVPECCGEPMAQAVATINYEDQRNKTSARDEATEGSRPLAPSKRK